MMFIEQDLFGELAPILQLRKDLLRLQKMQLALHAIPLLNTIMVECYCAAKKHSQYRHHKQSSHQQYNLQRGSPNI